MLAIWVIRLTSLRFTKWRKRDYETGQGEVKELGITEAQIDDIEAEQATFGDLA